MLSGKTALVTGGSTGIGRAIAAEYTEEGAEVVIASRSADTGEATGENIPFDGGWTAF